MDRLTLEVLAAHQPRRATRYSNSQYECASCAAAWIALEERVRPRANMEAVLTLTVLPSEGPVYCGKGGCGERMEYE